MRILASRILCGAALLAVAGPLSAAGVAHARPMGRIQAYPPFITRIPTYVLTEGSGVGTGACRLPPTGNGAATLQLYDKSGHVLYFVSATLVRATGFPPDGEAEQGGFQGTLLAIDIDGGLVPVAQVLGKWIRTTDGNGAFGADILVPASESRDHPLDTVGSISGALHAGIPGRGATGTEGLRERGARGLARLTAAWVVQP